MDRWLIRYGYFYHLEIRLIPSQSAGFVRFYLSVSCCMFLLVPAHFPPAGTAVLVRQVVGLARWVPLHPEPIVRPQ